MGDSPVAPPTLPTPVQAPHGETGGQWFRRMCEVHFVELLLLFFSLIMLASVHLRFDVNDNWFENKAGEVIAALIGATGGVMAGRASASKDGKS